MAKIAMIVSNRYDPDPRVHKEASALVSAGHRVVVYAFDRVHELPRYEEFEEGYCVFRVRTGLSPLGNLRATAVGLRSFKTRVKKLLRGDPPDVVHCHDQDTCSVGIWWKYVASKRCGISNAVFVFDCHDLYWTWLLMKDPDALWRRAGGAFLKSQAYLYAHAADLVITVTTGTTKRPGVAEIFEGWGVTAEVIWNAPREPDHVPALPDVFTVGYIGTVREPLMFEWLVDAVRLLPASQRPALLVAGSGVAQGAVGPLIMREAEKLGVHAQLSGRFTTREIPSLMAMSSIQYCLYPSARGNIDRAMPVKLLESVAYGRPVIGNAGTLMGEMIEKNEWGFAVEEANPGALAKAIASLREASGGPKTVPPRLRSVPLWADESEKLVAVYGRVLQKHGCQSDA